ncbi:polyol transporter 1 [Pyrus ussuriensis x Pyrus communis]|uniref:Polyol transporter 1 n=1 Tax=Pyrus ussuriensis x Pyrus communis TaxID=2448454 RepID=A0A5N5FJI6_9ROSA|nr:polyol transporter 1 [Pyrus ussuriensis x Pyrus communis]
MSGASLFIKENLNISDVQVEVLNGTLNIYSLIGFTLAGKTSDWLGRWYTIVLAGTIFFIGALLMGFAPNYAFLMFGRFIAGLHCRDLSSLVSWLPHIFPRGLFHYHIILSYNILTIFVFVNVGILLGYVSNFALAKLPIHLNWRIMLGIGAIPSVFLALGVLAMPESPRWLVMQGRLRDAKRVLNRTSSSEEESQLRLDEIKEAVGIPKDSKDEVVQVSKRSQGEGIWKELLIRPTPAVRHILIVALGTHFFQQLSGTDSVVLYSPRIFEKAGITSYNDKLLTTMAVGFVKTIAILVATFQVDRFGRRILLLSSVGRMVVSFILGVGLAVVDQSHSKVPWAVRLCITIVLFIVVFFSIGLGPITWVYRSEIFPLQLRAQGYSMGVAVNRVTSGVMSMTFISLYKAITIGVAFFLYMGITTLSWVFFYTLYPETQGRFLEDMEVLFGKYHKWREANAMLNKTKQVVHGFGDDNKAQIH